MDLDSARTESGSRASISSLRVQPLAGADLDAFREAARRNPQLQIRVEPEREHQLRQFSQAIGRVRLFALVLALLLGVGAVVASVNSMYAAIAIRQRAVATLWALGFAPSAMATAVFAEATVLGLLGGAAGAGAALLVADGYGLSILNGVTRTPFALSARVTSTSVVQGLSVAAILTALAAIAPCVSIARLWPRTIPRPTPP
jgi:putative ABC transport system permease protein